MVMQLQVYQSQGPTGFPTLAPTAYSPAEWYIRVAIPQPHAKPPTLYTVNATYDIFKDIIHTFHIALDTLITNSRTDIETLRL